MSVISITAIFIAFMIGLCAEANLWTPESLKESYNLLNRNSKRQFHKELLNILERQSLATKYQQRKIKVYTSSRSSQLLNLLFDQAFASINDPSIVCQFGGWMTHVENSECLPPWSRSVRNDPALEIFGEKYRNSCGGANLFRCNPVIFGPGDDDKGLCTTTDDSDPNFATSACIEEFNKDPNALQNYIDILADDPEHLAQYLAITIETLRFCETQSDPFSYCNELSGMLEDISSSAVTCSSEESLISFLPDIMTPFNEEEMNRITNGLGQKAIEYTEELEARQFLIRDQNKSILEQAIRDAQADPRMRDTITRIRDNADECLRGLCSGSRYSRSKPATKSIAKCAAYVKHAIFPYPSERGSRFSEFSEYPWGRDADDAVEGDNWLSDQGFVNILDYPEMSHLTPENAPVGAIIVYEKLNSRRSTVVNGQRRGAPGHIEIKASENEYISDFINDEPTRVGGLRRPIGIYYQIPPSVEAQIQEIPEV